MRLTQAKRDRVSKDFLLHVESLPLEELTLEVAVRCASLGRALKEADIPSLATNVNREGAIIIPTEFKLFR